jgi:hypothetical protein
VSVIVTMIVLWLCFMTVVICVDECWWLWCVRVGDCAWSALFLLVRCYVDVHVQCVHTCEQRKFLSNFLRHRANCAGSRARLVFLSLRHCCRVCSVWFSLVVALGSTVSWCMLFIWFKLDWNKLFWIQRLIWLSLCLLGGIVLDLCVWV